MPRKSAPWKVVLKPGQSINIVGSVGVSSLTPTIEGPDNVVLYAEGEAVQPKRKGGRPKGSKNRPKETPAAPEPKVKKTWKKKGKKAKKAAEPAPATSAEE